MPFFASLGILIVSYLIGSIPSGLLIVKFRTGKDIRQIESGRTGGTNAMRAAGLWAGLLTAILDILKAASCVWLTRFFFPTNHLLVSLTPCAAILGHNYSIFMIERSEGGKIRLRGGAGGAPSVGGAFGLWFPSIFITVPVGALILFVIGYASVTTLSVGIISIIIFAIRARMNLDPWEYILYGVIAELLVIWALRPNISRLLNGTERVVGLRARKTQDPKP
jgi:glycerol-3-phosphate acyltransferase PlsY